jgi:hypothetical protein
LPDEPFERDLLLLAPLLDELRALLPADFFAAFGLALDAFGFDDFGVDLGLDDDVDLGLDDDVDLAFDVDRFFGLAFVWAIVPLSSELVPLWIHDWFQWIGYPIHCREISMDGWVQRFSPPRRHAQGSASAG